VQPDGATRSRPELRVLFQNVEVLKAPAISDKAKQGLNQQAQTENLVLRVSDTQAVELAFSSDNGKVWVVLRPQVGAAQKAPSLTTLDRLLVGMDPIPLDRARARVRSLIGGGN
jgi:Flp pilus assembly protein RcpC/CpaB